MADISKEIQELEDAVYGEEVRGSFISVAKKVNEEVEGNTDKVTEYGEAEAGRAKAESARAAAEEERAEAESARASAEKARNTAETGRVSAEKSRVTAENGRVNAEKSRVSQENARKTAEDDRKEAETARAAAESKRASAEKTRASQETARVNAEKTRATAETGRVSAEKKRQQDTTAAVQDCEEAAERANTAAEAAEGVAAGTGMVMAKEKGAANGVATLDGDKKLAASQIPDIPAANINQDSTHRFVSDSEKTKWNTDIGEKTPTFTQASARANLTSKEKLKVSLGKIMKWFADLKPHAFETPITSKVTTETGHVPDATLIKDLQDQITALNSALADKIDNLQWTKPLDYVNNLYMGGVAFFIIDSDVARQIDLPDNSWWYVIHIAKSDNTGFAVQFFVELAGNGRVRRRWSSGSAWVGRDW